MRTCVVCGIGIEGAHGRKVVCSPPCKRERRNDLRRAWCAANPERVRAQWARQSARRDPQEARERTRLWRLANPEWNRENNRLWREKNRERIRAQHRKWERRRRAEFRAIVAVSREIGLVQQGAR